MQYYIRKCDRCENNVKRTKLTGPVVCFDCRRKRVLKTIRKYNKKKK